MAEIIGGDGQGYNDAIQQVGEGDIVLMPAMLTGRLPGLPKIGPKPKGNPTVGGICPLCGELFVVGCYTTMVPLGPGADPQARKLARTEKLPYEGITMELHWGCATGEPDVDDKPMIEVAQKLPPTS
jgi:hypothetical protein